MRRIFAALGGVLAFASVASAVEPILDLDSQRFEWERSYSRRYHGTYGQYSVTLEAGVEYELFTSNPVGGTTTDPYLYILNSSGTVLDSDDDSGDANNARFMFTPTTSGTYLVRLRAYSRGRYGFCSLTMHAHEEQAPPPTTEVVLGPGDVLNSQIFEWQSSFSSRSAGDYGQYTVPMTGGVSYTFETSNASGAGGDTYLYLLNSSFAVVASDDDSGPGLLSLMTFRPGSNGTYYLRLRAYDRGASGTCTLKVSGGGTTSGNPLHPDLITWVNSSYLRDAYVSWEGGRKLLRFSNTVANRGVGHLELYGVVNRSTGQTDAYQVVYNDNGTQTTHLVGTFSFAGHASHNHWHFDDFALYELRTTGGTLVRTSDKVTFCLTDTARYTAESVPNARSSAYYDCDNQGISVGWGDVYGDDLDGQSLDITGVADGTYRLVSTADPLDRLHETPNTNNVGEVTLTISGNSVTVGS